jgi:hypothetical protein
MRWAKHDHDTPSRGDEHRGSPTVDDREGRNPRTTSRDCGRNYLPEANEYQPGERRTTFRLTRCPARRVGVATGGQRPANPTLIGQRAGRAEAMAFGSADTGRIGPGASAGGYRHSGGLTNGVAP